MVLFGFGVEGAFDHLVKSDIEPIAAKLEVMREAMNDPLFLADLEEVAADFKHV